MVYSVAIIGGGCAGLSAAIYCARALLKPVVFADNYENKGGLLVKTSVVENYPGYADGINGFDLVYGMEQQAIKYGAEIINNRVINIDINSRPFTICDEQNNKYQTQTIIICTGSKPNKLGLENEDKFWANGISSCAVCDGALYRNKKIIVVGGGDTAMEEALFLTKFSEVTLIHRRNEFRASKIMQDRVKANPKIKIIYDTVITQLDGKDKLESIICQNIKTGLTFSIDVDGLFYGLGLTPQTELFTGKIDMDLDGYITNNFNHEYKTQTSMDGVFVAGDCHDKKYKQAITAAADGCKAALEVINYLNEKL